MQRHGFFFIIFVVCGILTFLTLSGIRLHFPSNPPVETPVETSTRRPTTILREYKNPLDPSDGVGYEFGRDIVYEPDPVPKLENLPTCDLTKDKIPMANNPQKIVSEFHKCIKPIVEQFKKEPELMNAEWDVRSYECDKLPFWWKLLIKRFRNLHEIRWTILPRCKEDERGNIMLSLGIGHDTKAEESLNRVLPNTKFYGVDPMISPNMQLYSVFGTFFPFAIGKASGIGRFMVLPNQNQRTRTYSYQNVTTIELTYFLHDMLKLQKIDIAWINIEGGEFQFLNYFYKGGAFDKKNITFCQFNLEVHPKFHQPHGEKMFLDFVIRMIKDGRYVFIKPIRTTIGIHRMFFINMEDKACVRKFIQ